MMLEKIYTGKENLATKFEMKFDFSGPHRPQRYKEKERKFQALYERVRATLNDAGINCEF
jgi:hypothetical protein